MDPANTIHHRCCYSVEWHVYYRTISSTWGCVLSMTNALILSSAPTLVDPILEATEEG